MIDVGSVWAVVPCFNRSLNTMRFLAHFAEQDYPNTHVVVTDDGSSDNTSFNIACNYPNVHIVEGDGTLWWAGGTNLAVRYALDHGADYILTINDDSQFSTNLVSSLCAAAALSPDHIVGSVIVSEDDVNTIWSVGSCTSMEEQRLMRLNFAGQHVDVLRTLPDPYPVPYMPGNGVLLPAGVFREVGYYDEVNLPQYHADSELVIRASRQGRFKPVIALQARVVNQILRKPLVNNVRDLLFNKKSDLYWPALATLFLRHYPELDLREIFNRLYTPFAPELEIPPLP